MNKILFILTIFYTTCINAQIDRDLVRANKYFSKSHFTEAIPLYKKSLNNNYSFNALKNIADAYFYIAQYDNASKYYKYLVNNYASLLDEVTYFRYAETLKSQNKYLESYNILRKYYRANDTTKLAILEKSIKYLENVKAIGNRFSIENLEINTKHSEFSAFRKGDTLLFASPRKPQDGTQKKYGWTGDQYLDIYKTSLKNLSEIYSFSTEVNSKLHESNIIITRDGKTAYFTRNNYSNGKRKKDKNKITHVQIFKTKFINGKWSEITSLPINSVNYSTEHPTLSPDEKTLYFASDMPGGYGSFDIYKVALLTNERLGTPKNLGPQINTNKKEQFPYVDSNNNLYFSSNGHPSFGGMDVFTVKLNNYTVSKPDNIGLPINSGYDDFSFFIDPISKIGYFSSNRPTGKGNDDIYEIKEQKPLIIEDCAQYISGVITDIDTKKPLSNATVTLSSNDKIIIQSTSDNLGHFKFNASCNTSYLITASKEKYKKKTAKLSLKNERKKNNDASLALKSILMQEKEKKAALALQLQKEHDLRLKKALQLEINKKEKIETTITKEDNIKKQDSTLLIKTPEVNFDYKLWYMRRDSKKASKVVIDLMKKYPAMIVEIGTHSDMRGNSKYNKDLSQKRANSVRLYLIDQGIDPGRIIAIGYGEEKPVIQCKTEEACSEEEHELNRRCEFVIKRIY